MTRARFLAAVAAAVLATAGMPAADARTYTVSMDDSFYSPVYRVIRVGDTVRWINEGTIEHTVSAFRDAKGAQEFESSPGVAYPESAVPSSCEPEGLPPQPKDCVKAGDTFVWTFSNAGTFDYFCKAHGSATKRPDPKAAPGAQPCQMCARIVVLPPQTAPTEEPTRRATRPPRASPSVTASPSVSITGTAAPLPTETPTLGGSNVAASGGDDGGTGAGRTGLAILAIGMLSGVGFWTWRRFLGAR